jgi:ANTAR domain/GAF domain
MVPPSDPTLGPVEPAWGELLNLAEAMRDLADRATSAEGLPALVDLVQLAVEQIDSARWASLSVLRGRTFRTEASTDPGATRADTLQYEMGFGPCVDALRDDSVYVSDDVASDQRWLEWGQRVHRDLQVRSVLAQRLRLGRDSGIIAALNIYSDTRHAFDERARATGLVLATHGGLLMNTMLANDRVRNLFRALESSREIGIAMGVLMHQHGLTQAQAFDVLRAASQDSNRRLADLANDVVDTGTLSIRGWPANRKVVRQPHDQRPDPPSRPPRTDRAFLRP